MQHTRSQAVGYRVLLASILSDDPVDEQDGSSLRRDASSNGFCYIQVIRSFHNGTHLARVATHSELLPKEGFTLMLSDAPIAAHEQGTDGVRAFTLVSSPPAILVR